MAKMTVSVDNGLEEVKLVKNEIKKNKNDKKEKNVKSKKVKKTKTKKQGYLTQVAVEMQKVTWPTKKNLVKYSIATILMIVLLALFFIGVTALFDLLYTLVQGWIG